MNDPEESWDSEAAKNFLGDLAQNTASPNGLDELMKELDFVMSLWFSEDLENPITEEIFENILKQHKDCSPEEIEAAKRTVRMRAFK